jgi:hypothetical protein
MKNDLIIRHAREHRRAERKEMISRNHPLPRIELYDCGPEKYQTLPMQKPLPLQGFFRRICIQISAKTSIVSDRKVRTATVSQERMFMMGPFLYFPMIRRSLTSRSMKTRMTGRIAPLTTWE